MAHRRSAGLRGPSGLVDQAHLLPVPRLSSNKREGVPIADVLEQRLAAAENNRTHRQPKLIDHSLVHQAGDERGAADSVDVLARLLLQAQDLLNLTNNGARLPADLSQSAREDKMGRPVCEARVGDLVLGWDR